jgi:hypothetical protein
MPSSTAVVTIDRPADVVWKAIADYGDPSWRGGIETCVLDGDVRTVTTSGRDLVLEETELHHDDAARTFTYSVTAVRGDTLVELDDGTTLDLRTMAGHHRATMTVVPVDDTSARVVYDLTIDDGHDETFESTTRQYRAVLDRLKRQLES